MESQWFSETFENMSLECSRQLKRSPQDTGVGHSRYRLQGRRIALKAENGFKTYYLRQKHFIFLLALILHFGFRRRAFLKLLSGGKTRFINQSISKPKIFMKELNLLEQWADNSPSETIALPIAAAMPEPDEMNLLEVMEFCSDICLAHPLCLLQILEEHCAETQTEICIVPLMAEIMSLKMSPFGKRLTQIH